MQYRSTQIGGTITGAGVKKAEEMARTGQRPDFRMPVTSKPVGALTSNKSIADQYPKTVTYKDAAEFVDVNGRPVEYLLSGVGSSTLVDTDGDIFHKSAIEGMARDAIDLNILLNHTPTLPWSLAGSVLETNVDFLKSGDTEHVLLKLVTDIENNHPDAWETYCMIAGIDRRPRKLGFSVGCLYVDTQPRTNKSGIYRGHDVFEVLPVEFSIVSMPANRLAWIDTIAYDLQEKGVIPKTDAFKAKRLREYATSDDMVYRITNWMDFGPVEGPKLERLAKLFEAQYGVVFANRPRSA